MPNKLNQPEIPIDFKQVMKGKLEKLSDNKFKGNHPNGIYEGYTMTGFYYDKPIINEGFTIVRGIRYLSTSTVTKIVSEDNNEIIFETSNSTYKLILIKE